MARTREPRERVQVEALDFAKVDPRIAERISVRLAQTADTMPRGWMMSFRPDEATVEDLIAPEWDAGMERYSEQLHTMADQAGAVWEEVPHTAENSVALFVAKQAVLNEGRAYFDPERGRPRAGLFRMLHWYSQLDKSLGVANEREFSQADQRRIIRGRMAALADELAYMLQMVNTGGWNNTDEKTKFCALVDGTRLQDTKTAVFTKWTEVGGDAAELEADWSQFERMVADYHQQFLEVPVPAEARPLGAERVKQYLESTGIIDEPAELIERCEAEAKALRSEIERLRAQYPESNMAANPADNDEIISCAKEVATWYQSHFVDSGIIPNKGIHLTAMDWKIRGEGQVHELFSAAIAPDGKTISLLPASATEAWSRLWLKVETMIVHELTHHVQKLNTSDIPSGWMVKAAEEGSAVAMEWLSLTDAEIAPAQMISYLEGILRLVVRTKLGLQFHTEQISEADLNAQAPQQIMDDNDYMVRNMITAAKTDFTTDSSYWIGSSFIAALTKQQHHGSLKAAMKQLAQTAFRLPGHVLIRNANPTQFHLTASLPKVPIPVQIARKRFPKPQTAS